MENKIQKRKLTNNSLEDKIKSNDKLKQKIENNILRLEQEKELQKTKENILNDDNTESFLKDLIKFIDSKLTLDSFIKKYPRIIDNQIEKEHFNNQENNKFNPIEVTVPRLFSLTSKKILESNELKWQIGECAAYYYLNKEYISLEPQKMSEIVIFELLEQYNPKLYILYKSKEVFNILNEIKEKNLKINYNSIFILNEGKRFIPSLNLKSIFVIGQKLMNKELTEIDLTGQNINLVYCEDCYGLTKLTAPDANEIDITNCENLTKLITSNNKKCFINCNDLRKSNIPNVTITNTTKYNTLIHSITLDNAKVTINKPNNLIQSTRKENGIMNISNLIN
ncbi:MAG TPA: hypothetical protein VLL98_01785 [Rickettsiales bacterium]|nr:hypothetical protein [Rickettsiales bacterium]